MLSNITVCPMASFIVLLLVITIILDSYIIFVIGLAPKHNIITIIAFFLVIIFNIFTVWLANNTCYKFIWISWIIVIYLVYDMVNLITTIIDPKKQEEIRKEYEKIDKEFDQNDKQTAQ